MRSLTKTLVAVLAVLGIVLLFAACTPGRPGAAPAAQAPADAVNGFLDLSTHYVITASSPLFLETGVDYMDWMSEQILQDLNASIYFIPVPAADLAARNRIWIMAGDMPDITWASFNYGDYRQFAEQGLIKPLPADYEEMFPNLAAAMAATGFVEPLKARHNGIIYGTPKPIFMDKFIYPWGTHTGTLYYRRDWADELGFPVRSRLTIHEVMEMAAAFMEHDPNGNGPGNTVGFAVEPPNMIWSFVAPFNPAFNRVIVDDAGQFVLGTPHEGTLQGLQALRHYFDEGIIFRDFFTIRARGEVEAMFNAGLTGLMINGGAFGNVRRLHNQFEQATGLNAIESIGMANITAPDGSIGSHQIANIQSISFMNPNMSHDKFMRILALKDHVATEEIQNLIHMGEEGTHFERDGDEIILTRPLTDAGDFVPMADLYPSYNLWGMLIIAWDCFTSRDPSTNPILLQRNRQLWIERTEYGNMVMNDFDLLFYSSPAFDRLNALLSLANLGSEFTNIVLSDDVESSLDDFLRGNNALITEALRDVNENARN